MIKIRIVYIQKVFSLSNVINRKNIFTKVCFQINEFYLKKNLLKNNNNALLLMKKKFFKTENNHS